MKLVKNICLLGASIALLTGCNSDLMDLTPYDSIASGNMWTTENLAEICINSTAMAFLPITAMEITLC